MSLVIDVGKSLAKILIPPPANATPEQRLLWDWSIFLALILVAGLSLAHTLASCGYLPIVSPGFATKTDLTNVTTQLTAIQKRLLDTDIRNARADQCRAIAEKNVPAMQYAYNRLQDEINEYYEKFNRQYRVPNCGEI